MFESVPFPESGWTPLFPLPNAVLLPRAILPLHVFEERYRVMARDALAGERLIAVALLRTGFERTDHTLDARIHDVVGVGKILRDERLPDGRYNLLLQGLARACVRSEDHTRPYRRARLMHVPARGVDPQQESELRARLERTLTSRPFCAFPDCDKWRSILHCPDIGLSEQVDILGSIVLRTADLKQEFLSEPRLCVRAQRLCEAIHEVASALNARVIRSRRPRSWPPVACDN